MASGDPDSTHIDFKLEEHINNVGVDKEVWEAYNSILRAKTVIPVQCAFFASMHQLALKEALVRRRQVRREDLSRSRKFTGTVKIWVQELKDIDLRYSLGDHFDGNLSLTVRVCVEGQSKGTTKSSPTRSVIDGSYEALKISQDVDFYVKRPTSIIHVEVLHINDDEPEGSATREILIGWAPISLQPLESQKGVRQWYQCVIGEHVTANLQLRAQYTYRDEVLPKWDQDAGLARTEEQGGPEYVVGLIGAGQIGTCVLEAVLRSSHLPPRNIYVSTRRPETLSYYEKLGVNVCFDNARVASKADILYIAVQPNNVTSVASVIRGLIRQETLVVSLVAGLTSERVAQLLEVPCVFKTVLGKAQGLPAPDDKEQQEANTRISGVVDAGSGSADELKKRKERVETSRREEAQTIANVGSAMRALVCDPDELQKLIVAVAKLLMVLVASEPSARDVAQGAICNFMKEQRILGQHVPMDELAPGVRVRMAGTTADMPERVGIVKEKLKNREEYIVVVMGKDVRCRRNRMAEEGGATHAEEGFAVEEYRQMKTSQQYSRFQEFFRKVGEQSVKGAVPTAAGGEAVIVDEKSLAFSDKGMALGRPRALRA